MAKTKDELLIENRMLHDEVKRLQALVSSDFSDTRLLRAGPEGTGFMFDLQGGPIQYIAEYLAEILGYKDAKDGEDPANYAEIQATHPKIGKMIVSLQRVSGLTPHQKVKAAEKRVSELEAELAIVKKVRITSGNIE